MKYLSQSTIEELQLNWAEIIYIRAFGWVEGDRAATFREVVEPEKLPERMEIALSTLAPRQADILRLRAERKTLAEIGSRFGCGPENIRRIEQKALRKLRHPSRALALKIPFQTKLSRETIYAMRDAGLLVEDITSGPTHQIIRFLKWDEVRQTVLEQAKQEPPSPADPTISPRPPLNLSDMLGIFLTDQELFGRVMQVLNDPDHPHTVAELETTGHSESSALLAQLIAAKQLSKTLLQADDLSDPLAPILSPAEKHRRQQLSAPILELGLSTRAYNVLRFNDIQTVGDLVKWTENRLLRLRGMGRTTAAEIKLKLANFGFNLKEE